MRTYCASDIEYAMRSVQVGRTQNILKPICILCGQFLSCGDVRTNQAVCWRCRRNQIARAF